MRHRSCTCYYSAAKVLLTLGSRYPKKNMKRALVAGTSEVVDNESAEHHIIAVSWSVLMSITSLTTSLIVSVLNARRALPLRTTFHDS